MEKEYKTLTFEDTASGRRKMAEEIDKLAKEGWTIKSKEVSGQGWDGGTTCCLGCLFLPLALLGKKNNLITVIMEKGKTEIIGIASELEKLSKLKDKGVLTHEQFEAQKKILLKPIEGNKNN